MIASLLSLPFRLLGLLIMVGAIYLGWTYRAELRRWIHRATADQPAERVPAPGPSETAANRAQATRRLDSLASRSADSVILLPDEVQGLIVEPLRDRAGSSVENVMVRLGQGEIELEGKVDPRRLPEGALGPLGEWIKNPETVTARGPFGLRRLGLAEWRVDEVKIRGLPVPRAIWSRLLPRDGAAEDGILTVPLEPWVTGIRVRPGGLVLYGEGGGR